MNDGDCGLEKRKMKARRLRLEMMIRNEDNGKKRRSGNHMFGDVRDEEKEGIDFQICKDMAMRKPWTYRGREAVSLFFIKCYFSLLRQAERGLTMIQELSSYSVLTL